MNAYHSLVLMAVRVGTRWDPTSVSVQMASVEAAVRQVKPQLSRLLFKSPVHVHTLIASYVCVFPPLADIKTCLSEPCEHGGTCEDRPGSYLCHCSQGFKGQNCEMGTM